MVLWEGGFGSPQEEGTLREEEERGFTLPVV